MELKMDTNKKNREYISALMDGEIPDADLELAMAALDGPDGERAWDTFHHIGDLLRAGAGAGTNASAGAAPAGELSPGFSARLAARLAEEPLPGKRAAGAAEPATTTEIAGPR